MTKTKPSLATLIVMSMVLGGALGYLLGPSAVSMGAIGRMYIDLIKMMAIPLVFFSIVDAVTSTSISWRSASRWICIIACNTTCALVLGLSISNLFQPGRGFPVSSVDTSTLSKVGEVHPPSFLEIVENVIPKTVIQPFADNNVLSVVLLALLIGAAIRKHLNHTPGSHGHARQLSQDILNVWSIALMWTVQLVPLAVFCVTAKTVGELGFAPFKGLAGYVALGFLGLSLQVLLVYSVWIFAVSKVPVRLFLSLARKPIVYAFGTNSSLATLPLTLDSLDKLGVSKSSSRLGACIGTNFNNDGIILYEAMAVLFVAQAIGIDLSLGQQVVAALISLVAAVGVAGVPEAGVVSLSLVLTAVGLPLDILPLLLTVDWLVARMRSVVNVLSDMTVSIAIDGLSREASR